MFLHFHKKEGRRHIINSISGISSSVLFLLGEKIKEKGQRKERKMILLQKAKTSGLEVTSAAGLSDFQTIEEMVWLRAR